MLTVIALFTQPAMANATTATTTATPEAHYYWDDGHFRINVSYTEAAFNGSANGGPALIPDGKYVFSTNANRAYQYCQQHTSAGYIHTRECMNEAGGQIKADLKSLDYYLGPLTQCEAPIGRRLLQDRHSLSVVFASAGLYYGYSVAAGYAGHYFPHLIGPHLSIQIVAGLLALTVIGHHFLNVLASRSPTFPELLATVGSWFAESALVTAAHQLREHIRETIAKYFEHRRQSPPSCAMLADMV